MPVRLRPEDHFPGDNVASSIQACEACRVGASPTHLTISVPVESPKVAVARRRNGSDGVALGTVAAARDGYQNQFHFTGSAYWQTVHPTLNR